MELTVLGYWGGYPWKNEGTSSYLLQSEGFNLLIDAGSNTLTVLQEKLDPLKLDSVIISHYHYDHIADLGVLQYYRQLHPKGQPTPVLPIYGHDLDVHNFASLTLPGVSEGRAYHENRGLEIGPFRLTFLRTKHPVICFAMRIEEISTGKVLVYTADSGWIPEFSDFVKEANVLIADTYFLQGTENHHAHLSSLEAGNLARDGQVNTLVLSHLQQELALTELLKEAKSAAGPAVDVLLATKNLTLII